MMIRMRMRIEDDSCRSKSKIRMIGVIKIIQIVMRIENDRE